MMNDLKKNKELVTAFCDAVFVNHDLSGLERFLREDYIQHNADVAQGRAGFKEFFETTFRAMPDFRYTLKKIVAEGDLVFINCTTTATHTGGDWLGMPPSGNRLRIRRGRHVQDRRRPHRRALGCGGHVEPVYTVGQGEGFLTLREGATQAPVNCGGVCV